MLDFVGIWQHFTTPVSEFEEEVFEDGLGFDGSSIRGWQPIHNSDMAIVPDPNTAMIDPFVEMTTLSLICNIYDPITKEGAAVPRYIAQRPKLTPVHWHRRHRLLRSLSRNSSH
ncbi:MAG: glutamine synthetase [Syntrophotaleaceae bacterium]